MPSETSNHDNEFDTKVMWTEDYTETQMYDFLQKVNKQYALNMNSYNDLWEWSVKNYPNFWKEVWSYCHIKASKSFDAVVNAEENITSVPKWFVGSKLNYAENLLRYSDANIALISTGEGQEPKKMTYGKLCKQVELVASSLKRFGVVVGDRVAGYIPNCMECVIVMLACASIGAIWSSTSPDFGVKGVLDRFDQIKPKILVSVNGVHYNGRVHNHWEKLQKVAESLDDVEHVIVIPFVACEPDDFNTNLSTIKKSMSWESLIDTGERYRQELTFEQLSFDHPLFIMYSSGTTGKPKCMVHSAGGTLLQHAKEHILHGDMRREDVFIYYTTTGWMMWNWLIGALITGCTLVLYDGSPFKPTPTVLWDMVDELGVTVLGVSAKCLAVMEEQGQAPRHSHRLETLRTVLSTGSPLAPHQYDFVYEKIKSDVLLGSITGGTDIISCFAGHNCMKPVVRGEIQSANLGMAIRCYDEEGREVFDEAGELVCTAPFPSMPTHFWLDDQHMSLYRKAYFDKFPGVWSHGDYCMQSSATRGWRFLGRSDATLNPNGIRIGTAEIYSIMENSFGEEVADSVAAAYRPTASDELMVLFVVMREGRELDATLERSIRVAIRAQLSPRHVPALLKTVADIPYTLSGKKVEVAVTKMLAGQPVHHRSAFRNPDSLELYKGILDDKESS